MRYQDASDTRDMRNQEMSLVLAQLTSDFLFASLALKYPHDGKRRRDDDDPPVEIDNDADVQIVRPVCGTRRKVPRALSPLAAERAAFVAKISPAQDAEDDDLRDLVHIPDTLLPYARADTDAEDAVCYRGIVVARVKSRAVGALVKEVLRATTMPR